MTDGRADTRLSGRAARFGSSIRYMPALDGLRAVSVFMVFAIHAFPGGTFPGGLGVDVFFVISGFLITTILLREHNKTGRISLRKFYLKRALRLYPAFLVMVAVFLAAFSLLQITFARDLRDSAISLTYLSNIWMTVTGTSLNHLSHTWSLAMEEQFYLVWPLMLILILRLGMPRSAIVILLGVLTAASFVGWVLTADDFPYNPLTKAGGLLVGCIAAVLVERRPWESKTLAYCSVAAFVLVFAAETAGWIGREISMPVASVAVAGMILHLAYGQGWLVTALSGRIVTYLGSISYAIYLWHYPIIYALRKSTELPDVAIAAIALVATLALSAASQKLIERPAMRLKARLG